MIIGFKNHGLLIRFVIIFFCLNTYSFGEVTNSLARFNLIESFEADFTQKVFDGESTVEEIVKGKFIFKRPANFLWISDSPYNQQIKSDGEYLSIYDVDFEQNIIRSLSDEIKHSPLYMLFNDVREISNEYLIEEVNEKLGETIETIINIPIGLDNNIYRHNFVVNPLTNTFNYTYLNVNEKNSDLTRTQVIEFYRSNMSTNFQDKPNN